MIGLPEIEILEGPAGVTLSIKEEEVLPRVHGCAAKVPGGRLMMSVKGITEQTEAKVTYRLNYKTKDGPRQTSQSYILSLFPCKRACDASPMSEPSLRKQTPVADFGSRPARAGAGVMRLPRKPTRKR